jgi:hypothetical protein
VSPAKGGDVARPLPLVRRGLDEWDRARAFDRWVTLPLESFLIFVETLGEQRVEEDGEMNQEPERDAREGVNRDGLAAVAITILAVSLIVFVVSRII